MTPPRPPGFGPLSWLWWPVLFAGWGLAGAVMAAEMAIAGPWQPRGGRGEAGGRVSRPKAYPPLKLVEIGGDRLSVPHARGARE